MSCDDNIRDNGVTRTYYTFEELQACADNDFQDLNVVKLARTPPHEIGAWLERLPGEEREIVLKKLSVDNATEVLAEMDAEDSAEIISEMRDAKAVKILVSLAPDDAAGMLRELEDDVRDRLLAKMPRKVSGTLRNLLTYDPNTAGGVMTPYIATLTGAMTVDSAIDVLRKNKDIAENTDNIYVIDDSGCLTGVLSVQKLLWTAPDEEIKNIMCRDVEGTCTPEQDKESVAQIMAQSRFNTLPVVDAQNKLVGIITHDDVIDIIREEATEDIQKLHGAGGDENIHDGIIHSIFRRLPWLVMNLLIAFVTASVINIFEARIAKCTFLAVFMGMISGLSGNSGAQTLAVAIRSFATGDYHQGDSPGILFRETIKGIMNGLLIGVVAGIASGIWAHNARLGVVVLVSIIMNMGLAGLVGAFIPIFLTKMKCDPAQSSYMFLTSITDIVGMFIFLGLGAYFLM